MSTTTTEKTNRQGFKWSDYQGLPSTLCKGCGHDNITRNIIQAYFELGVVPSNVVKTSGIGCSSKTPAYFVHRGYGVNAVHGRMPSITLGAKLANYKLEVIGVSGDGDSASIGMGQFCHAIRRNLDMVYVVENNGVYGLTKGQFSATAERGAKSKTGEENALSDIDLCALAITLGGTFVARGFSNDPKQMLSLVKASVAHKGTSMLDVISPCVTFNNHEASTKSIHYVMEHDIHLNDLGFVAPWEQPVTDIKPGEAIDIPLPDGSHIVVRAVGKAFDPHDKFAALQVLEESRRKGEILTGLIYIAEKEPDFNTATKVPTDRPLTTMNEADCRMPREAFEKTFAGFR
ncbi:MAG TPA: 2-oxoacid:ferredoxin oxidoreductase subunit beta [Planctomycetota bacterium]|jgi:2-oxoglutarate ferredoxin oxidoreductase subunit beta|nr:2-oxoacid:ferredoxin oxidoreductase subunit beta [Planctomycetota bacterium]